MTFFLGDRSVRNMVGLDPRLIKVVARGIVLTTQDFGVAAKAARSALEQHVLYEQGRSQPGRIVTQADGYKNKSNHQVHSDNFGHAVDLTPFINGSFDVDNPEAQYPIAVAMSKASAELGIPLTWGGNWYEQLVGTTIAEMKASEARYRIKHPGRDMIDLPHYELRVS